MFCPKCGLQNADDTKFCRGCGSELTRVLASLDGKPKKANPSLSERSVALYSRGVRGVLTSVGFMAITVLVGVFGEQDKIWWIVPLTLAFVWFAAAISRFVQASGYKKLAANERRPKLGAGREEFLEPARSFYETDELAAPFSVTERTTNLLRRMDEEQDLVD